MHAFIAVYLILITSIILAIMMSYISREKYETTSVATKIVFTSHPLNDRYWAAAGQYPPPAGYLFKYLGNTQEYLGILGLQSASIDGELYVTADDYHAQKYGLESAVARSPTAYFVRLGLPEIMSKLDCTYSLLNKKIGYVDETDIGFIRGLMAAYRSDFYKANLVQVPILAWKDLRAYIKAEQIDTIITHIIPYGELHLLLLDQSVVLDGFTGIDPERMRIMFPWARLSEIDYKLWRLPGSILLVNSTNKAPLYAFKKGLYSIQSEPPAAEGFADVVREYKESADAGDVSYKCYGSLQTTRKIACESPYDMLGEPKNHHTEWDQPCKTDRDCPYYNGERGGCGPGGICELPLGVRRLGFKKHNGSGLYAPYCYNYLGICTGKGDDYAFKDDGRQTDPQEYQILF